VRNRIVLLLGLSTFVPKFHAESIPTIRRTVSEVQLAMVATDQAGRPVPGLSAMDIAILEDGTPVARFDVRPASDLALQLGIVFDLSDSTQATWATTEPAVSGFLQRLVRPGDEVLVLTFDSKVREESIIGEPRQLRDVIPRRTSGGQTALYDAVYSACQHRIFAPAGEPRRSALIVFSDGQDNLSWHDLDAAITNAQRTGIAVYTIATHSHRRQNSGDGVLRTLAMATGGRDFVVSDPEELQQALLAISGELRSVYFLYYRPANESGKREFRRVRVVPTQSHGPVLRYREGHFTAPAAHP
jgi:Ca-activated chloride channel family protein